ncbi:hypothetical protein [Micromonospora parva]|uniref:hypothetical protein n=1 Tax=Micromonospora parva TaxID=1464048 RepID=UPI0033EECA48
MALVVVGACVIVALMHNLGAAPQPPGDELATDQVPYGWQVSKDVGTTFTDGLNLVTVTPKARGPLRLISARPLMDEGGSVRVLGVLARVNPDMLPPGANVGSFQEGTGFPPAQPHAAGAVPIKGLKVQPPQQGESRWIELQIGYEVVGLGRSVRRGVELVYEYEGAQHKAFIPSYVAVCAPAAITCAPEYDK